MSHSKRVSMLLLNYCFVLIFVLKDAASQIQFDGGNGIDIIFDDAPPASSPSCLTPEQRQGFCQPLAQCAIFYAEIPSLLDNPCQTEAGNQGVCCPVQSNQAQAKPRPGIGNDGVISKPPPPPVVIPRISVEQVQASVDVGLKNFEDRERNVNKILFQDKIQIPQGSPAASHQRFFTTTNSILDQGNKAQLNIEASVNLVDNLRLSRLQGTFALPHISIKNTKIEDTCPPQSQCNPNFPYRTVDGSCNNQQNPDWGKAGTAFQRIIAPKYGDVKFVLSPEGVSSPREFTASGQPLPSARLISSQFLQDANIPANFTLMVMQWGQFVDHDLTHTPISKGTNQTSISCCQSGQFLSVSLVHPDCFQISIPPNDPFYQQFNQRCMEFVRSLPAPRRECNFGPREQMNQITAYHDGSNVYGSSEQRARSLRENVGGRLLTQQGRGKQLLPANPNECSDSTKQRFCFRAGDTRVNEQLDLALIHTIFLREHNRIAGILQQLNPNWSDEVLYQEARRVVIAIMTHITYNEFLPLILGPEFMRTFKLHPIKQGYTSVYNREVDSTITNAFATAAFRFGHTLVQGNIMGFNQFGSLTDNMQLEKSQFTPFPLYDNFDTFVRGLANQQCQRFDNFITKALTNHLFQGGSQFGLDLMSLNIQRGRDHGLPPYNEWREVCGLPKLQSWEDVAEIMTPEAARSLSSIYNSVDDIDLFVGGLGEQPLKDALLGPVFVCIVGDQFARLKLGDRFFYEERTARFTEGQLDQIRKVSLARVLCDNSDDIDVIQPLVFQQASFLNQRQPCSSNIIAGIDFNFWREARRPTQNQQQSPPQGQRPVQGRPIQQQGSQGQRPFQNQQVQRPQNQQRFPNQRPFQNQQGNSGQRPFQGQQGNSGQRPFQNQGFFG